MSLRAGFAEVDITPPVGIRKFGLMKAIVSDHVLDPLYGRVAIVESAGGQVAFIQLDTLFIDFDQVVQIRSRISQEYGFPSDNIMIAATHNHAGPAVWGAEDVRGDADYVETLVKRLVSTFGRARECLQEAEIGFGSCFEFNVGHNRRVVMRDGTVRTLGKFTNPNALCAEGPIDPEFAGLVARNKNGEVLGAIVNFSCHPIHHVGETSLSAGYPGVLARTMKTEVCPVTLFLNGASGNIGPRDPSRGGTPKSKEEIGAILADDLSKIIEQMVFRTQVKLRCRSKTIRLPFRKVTDSEIRGVIKGSQRLMDSSIYDRAIPGVLERIRRLGTEPALVQVILIDEYAYVGIPAEYFAELGLRIKEQVYPAHALIVGYANGCVGYVPHKEAFLRGGYETTFGEFSRLAPEAGDILADSAIELIKEEVLSQRFVPHS